MPSSHLILCHPILLLPPIPPSIKVFSNESTLHMRWPKYWSFSFSIIPSKEIPGADLLQNGLVGSPCSPRDSQELSPTSQFKSINSWALSFPYSPTITSIHDYWKTIALTRCTFVGKVMSLLFNMLSRLVKTFLPVQYSSDTQSCPTLCDPMNRSMPGLPVHHQLPEFIQTHVHRVSDTIQPSHPRSSPFPPAFNLSQHQGLFK